MRYYLTYLFPLLGLLIAGLLIAGVMMDSAGYRWCDTYTNAQCPSPAVGSPEGGLR